MNVVKPGARFGRWTVIGQTFNRHDDRGMCVRARCSCGYEGDIRATRLRHGYTTRCLTCANRANAIARVRKRREYDEETRRIQAEFAERSAMDEAIRDGTAAELAWRLAQ